MEQFVLNLFKKKNIINTSECDLLVSPSRHASLH